MSVSLLIVTNRTQFSDRVRGLVSTLGIDQVYTARHENAVEMFRGLEPTHVLVSRYEEPKDDEEPIEGIQTWQALEPFQGQARLTRCGFREYDYPDYFVLPLTLDKLQKTLFPKTKLMSV